MVAWEQRKVSDIVKFHKQGFYTKESYSENNKYFLLRGTELTSNKLVLNDTPKINATEKDYNDFKVDKGDFLIVRSGTVGTYGIVYDDIKAIFGSYLINFRFDMGIVTNEFFGLFYQSNVFKNQLNKIIQKSSNVNINAENIKSTTITLPYIEEQQKISSFFKNLDDSITLQERELELLKLTKKGFLQQLFTDNQQKFPNIRFANFHDEWQQRKLGNYAEILTGGTPKTSVHKYWEPKLVPWMSSGEVNKKRLNKTDNMISKEGLNNSSAHWIKKHSVLIALAGQGKTRGTVAINNIELTTNQSIAAIVPTDTFYYEFIYQNLIKRYEELRKISSGDGTRGGLNKQIISDVIIMSPNKMEQVLIGSFLKQLDRSITLQENELENLKNIKSAFLQKMFI